MFLKNFWQDEKGQDLIEYTLLMAFMAMGAFWLVGISGAYTWAIWWHANNQLSQANTLASN